MSDPIFLRSMMSSSIYAEQAHSAQIQGHQAARERATRLRQEQIRNEQASIQRMVEAGKAGIGEREGHGRGAEENLEDEQARDRSGQTGDMPESLNSKEGGAQVRHIDLTA